MEVSVDDGSGVQELMESLIEHAWLGEDVVHGLLVLPDGGGSLNRGGSRGRSGARPRAAGA